MKRILFILWAFLSACVGFAQAQTVSFNFTAAPVTVSGWTNISGDPATGTRSGTASGISVTSIGTANWAGYNGSAAFNGGGVSNGTFFPSGVMANQWFQYSGFYAAYNAAVPQLEISGLNKDSVYTIKMTASFNTVANPSFDLNPTRYTVAGLTNYGNVDINGNNNAAGGAVYHNVVPDANGKVRVYVNTYGGSNTAGISGLQVIRERTAGVTPTVVITHPANNNIIPEDGNVSFSATATETGGSISKVEFYANDVLIGADSVAPYSISWVSPDPGSYTLKARAIDGFGNISIATITVTVQSLNYFWSTTGNIATGADSSFVGTVDTNRLAFRTNNIERMTILKDGTIGIGTKDTYGYKLAVNGTAIFTKVRVKTAGTWPDYVFKKGYALPDLKELERYVAEHKHLPGIVSEKEVNKEGFDLGDHQAALLKKVEELTLYLINENKQLRTQNQQISEQNKKITEQNARLEEQQRQINELKRLINPKK